MRTEAGTLLLRWLCSYTEPPWNKETCPGKHTWSTLSPHLPVDVNSTNTILSYACLEIFRFQNLSVSAFQHWVFLTLHGNWLHFRNRAHLAFSLGPKILVVSITNQLPFQIKRREIWELEATAPSYSTGDNQREETTVAAKLALMLL